MLDSPTASAPILRTNTIEKAAWFEILLFRTKLRFRNPKATNKVKKDEAGNLVDKRPFLNTVAKTDYDCNDKLGRCIVDIYNSSWKLYPKRFSRSYAVLDLCVYGLGVTTMDRRLYRDLYNTETATVWIKNYYFCRLSSMDELPGQADDGEQTQIQDNNAEKNFRLYEMTMNGYKTYLTNQSPNRLDYFIPFTEADMLQFSFTLTPKNRKAESQRLDLMREVENFAHSILNTISMKFEEPK